MKGNPSSLLSDTATGHATGNCAAGKHMVKIFGKMESHVPQERVALLVQESSENRGCVSSRRPWGSKVRDNLRYLTPVYVQYPISVLYPYGRTSAHGSIDQSIVVHVLLFIHTHTATPITLPALHEVCIHWPRPRAN